MPNSEIKVSVVIPAYNVEKYVGEAVRSVLAQTLGDIEVIIVDDGSTDGTLGILQNIAQEDPRVRVISTQNNGVGVARNTAMACARGEYIYFLDGDDALLPETLETCYNKGISQNLDIVLFDGEPFYESGLSAQDYPFNYKRSRIYEGNVYRGSVLAKEMLERGDYRSNVVLNIYNLRFIKESNVLFSSCLHEDELFTIQCMIRANRVAHIAQPFFLRRVRPDSIMTTQYEKANALGYISTCRALKSYLNYSDLDTDARYLVRSELSALAQIIVWKVPGMKHKTEWHDVYDVTRKEFLGYMPLAARVRLLAPRVYEWTRGILKRGK